MSKDHFLNDDVDVEIVDKIYVCRFFDYKETKEYKCKSNTKKKAIQEGIKHFNLKSKNIEINFNKWIKNDKIINNIWLRILK